MKKIVTFGEIMLRLATPEYLRFAQATSYEATFGGGEANVAVSLAGFGMETSFVTRLPENDIARACRDELRRHGVGTSDIVWGGERLGIYYLETGAVSRPSKVVYDRAHSSISTIQPGMIDWERIFAGADWFHFTGITPALSQSAADVCLEAARAANRLGVTVSCDLNYRKNLWKYGKSCMEVMPALVECCDVIIANEEDAEKVFGIKPEGFDVTATGGEVDAARFDQRQPQYLGGGALHRRAVVRFAAVRHHPHRRPGRRRRLVRRGTDLRPADLWRGFPADDRFCRGGIVPQAHDQGRLQPGDDRRGRKIDGWRRLGPGVAVG